MKPLQKVDGKAASSGGDKAKLIIDVPQDARLYIDGQLVKTTSSKPVFTTPILANGQSYYYDVRAEIVRDGKIYSEN